MGCIAVNLDIEDVTTTGEVVIWSLNLGLVTCTALVVYRYVVAVCIVVAVGNASDYAKAFAIATCETSRETLGWSFQNTVVMLILL